MKQICIIHGGDTYSTYEKYRQTLTNLTVNYERLKPTKGWKLWLAEQLTDDDVLLPSMPNSSNAQYDEWVEMFEKIIPFFETDFVLVGNSLGGIFLAKYLTENTLPRPAEKLIFVAAPYADESKYDNASFALTSTPDFKSNALDVHFFHSTDDPVVPFSELEHFRKAVPTASFHEFNDKQHFNQETFPELLELIK